MVELLKEYLKNLKEKEEMQRISHFWIPSKI